MLYYMVVIHMIIQNNMTMKMNMNMKRQIGAIATTYSKSTKISLRASLESALEENYLIIIIIRRVRSRVRITLVCTLV